MEDSIVVLDFLFVRQVQFKHLSTSRIFMKTVTHVKNLPPKAGNSKFPVGWAERLIE